MGDQDLKWLFDIASEYLPKIALAIVTLIIGFWIVGAVVKVVKRGLERSKVDAQLVPFLGSILSVLLKVALLISVASTLGIETTSFVAVIGAMGFAVGLALQGSLANFAGGVMLLVLKPFKPGDVIDAMGQVGIVKETQILHTIVNSFDNKRIILPNGPLAAATITNVTAEDTRRVDLKMGVGYDDDLKKTFDVLKGMFEGHEKVIQDKGIAIDISEYGDSSITFFIRVWCKTSDYWAVYWHFHNNVKHKFDEAGISIPFPQRDVHIYEEKKA